MTNIVPILKRLTRRRPSTILCQTKYKQCIGKLHIKGTNKYCALGVILKETYGGRVSNEVGGIFSAGNASRLRRLGITFPRMCDIVDMNDKQRMSFKQICKQLKEWGL
jgi:hypothetical protein